MENNPTKIALVTCFLGKLPWYFRLFLKTCAANHSVDFVFISDQENTWELPHNFKWIHKQVPEIEALICKKTRLNVSVEYAYKLCDIKPAYGVIFEDYLKTYDFWGHCDIDIIFGDIRNFITEEILQNHDIICVTTNYVTGFFTLFRNNEFVNRAYEASKDYKYVFESDKHFCFDECNHLFGPLIKGRSVFELNFEVESMTHVIKKLDKEGKIRAFFDQFVVEARPGKMRWDNGILLIRDKYEILLYHMIEFKKLRYYFFPFWRKIPDQFYIESFYFSKYAPGSFAGAVSRYYYSILKRSKLFFRAIVNMLTSSAQIKRKQFKNPEEYSGHYAQLLPTTAHTEVVLEKNQFLIQFYKGRPLPLRHIKNNLFYCKKWKIEIEFGYSKLAQKLYMHGRSLVSESQSREYKR